MQDSLAAESVSFKKNGHIAENCFLGLTSKVCRMPENEVNLLLFYKRNQQIDSVSNNKAKFGCELKLKTNMSVFKSNVAFLTSGANI